MEESNSMGALNDYKTTSHMRKRGHGKEKETLKGNFKSLLMAAQNNAIRNNQIKTRIDKTQQNRKCRLCGD